MSPAPNVTEVNRNIHKVTSNLHKHTNDMKKEVVKIKGLAKPPNPFNHIVRAGNLLFLSSQLSVDLKKHKLLGGTIEEQTQQALENVKFLLESCGSKMNNVVKVVVYMRDVKQFDQMNRVYRKYFAEGEEPARVAIQAKSPLPEIDIEIEAVAIINE